MGWNWRNAVGGAVAGGLAGGPAGLIIGGVAGGMYGQTLINKVGLGGGKSAPNVGGGQINNGDTSQQAAQKAYLQEQSARQNAGGTNPSLLGGLSVLNKRKSTSVLGAS